MESKNANRLFSLIVTCCHNNSEETMKRWITKMKESLKLKHNDGLSLLLFFLFFYYFVSKLCCFVMFFYYSNRFSDHYNCTSYLPASWCILFSACDVFLLQYSPVLLCSLHCRYINN